MDVTPIRASYAAPVAPVPVPAPVPRRRRRGRRWVAVALVLLVGLVVHTLGGGDASAHYSFIDGTDQDSTPVTWDNCKAIHVVVNPQNAPADWPQILDAAIGEIMAVSDYVIVQDGLTTDHDFAGGRYEGNPVLMGWGVRRELPRLGVDAAGLGGPITFPTATGPRYASGIVLLDSLYFDQLEREGQRVWMQEIVEHELMHVLGLGHVDDLTQVMAGAGHYTDDPRLGAGDIAGLAALHAVPCP